MPKLFPDMDLINLPNIALIALSAIAALVLVHCVSIPFEEN